MRRSAFGVILAVLWLAGCGGGADLYTLGKTRACLAGQGSVKLRPVRAEDFVATSAPGGALRVEFPANEVTVSFGETEEEAARLERAYRRFRGENIGIDDVLRPKRNAVLLWKAHPSEAEIETVDGCLK